MFVDTSQSLLQRHKGQVELPTKAIIPPSIGRWSTVYSSIVSRSKRIFLFNSPSLPTRGSLLYRQFSRSDILYCGKNVIKIAECSERHFLPFTKCYEVWDPQSAATPKITGVWASAYRVLLWQRAGQSPWRLTDQTHRHQRKRGPASPQLEVWRKDGSLGTCRVQTHYLMSALVLTPEKLR
jgi:hypothetical protein